MYSRSLLSLSVFIAVVACVAAVACGRAEGDEPILVPTTQKASKFFQAIESHMDYLTEHSTDQLGDEETPMWLAAIDVRTNGLPKPLSPKHARWRNDSPTGGNANLYWDQATIVAAYKLAQRSGCACYEDAADAYIRDFLEWCVDEKTGEFGWGHRGCYDVTEDELVWKRDAMGLQPHTPAWETFWKVDNEKTRRAIMGMANRRLDRATTDHVSIAHDAVVIDSLTWLAVQSDPVEPALVKSALELARQRFGTRDAKTRLLAESLGGRHLATTSIGLWSGSLVRAYERTEQVEFLNMADEAMRAWLERAYDPDADAYFGALLPETGKPHSREESVSGVPPMHADPFDAGVRPSGHFPLPMAETCLSLWLETESPVYRTAVDRWIKMIAEQIAGDFEAVVFAEDFGRAIHFLDRAGDVFEQDDLKDLARMAAERAMEELFVKRMGMFRGHTGEDRCDAADGTGFLLLSLLGLEGKLTDSALAW